MLRRWFGRGDAGEEKKEQATIERMEKGLEKPDAPNVTVTDAPTDFVPPRRIVREDESEMHELIEPNKAPETVPTHPAEYLKPWKGYHGYIGDFEARCAIRHDGQYLIRLEDVRGQTNILICVGEPLRHDKRWRRPGMPKEAEEDPDPVIRVRTHVVEKDKRGYFSIEDDYCFESVEDLLGFYVFHGEKWKLAAQLRYAVPRRNFEFRPRYIERKKKLGSGIYGDVFLAAINYPGFWNEQAVGKAVKQGRTNSAELSRKMIEEGRILLNLSHPNVVQMYGWCLDNHPFMLLLQYLPDGSLDLFLLEKFEYTSLHHLVQFALDAAQGLAYIHSQKIIHRNISARSCLLTRKGNVKISDFELSVKGCYYRMRKAERLPTRYVAPESLICFVFIAKSDCYTFGNLLFEIFSGGTIPYENLPSDEIRENILCGITNKLPSRTPDSLVKFTEERIWGYTFIERPNANEIVDFLENLLKEMKDKAKVATVGEEDEELNRNEAKSRKNRLHCKVRREDLLEEFCPMQVSTA
ncbi:unnamed protein product [Caenorhabditis auriculariae]|uniref:Protein kinase domain-containing protein n=1 Tax=Caenorhabditis auriculariae TaxID=2777116 RepID=A0A8S1HLJ3_9PELO|nr:unnamed protein product [Caenorhabditis auriculariae]